MLDRREFLQRSLALGAAAGAAGAVGAGSPEEVVVTVAGPVAPDALGPILPHEHVLVDFIGADKISRDRYRSEEVEEVVLPHLARLKEVGCGTLVECTPAYLGRDARLLVRLWEASGMRLVTNTGYYGAAGGKYLPQHARDESADDLARRWLAEWHDGIEDSGARPGFIKIGVDGGPLTEVNRKLVQAAARAHRESGLPIAAHTGDGAAALEQLDVLDKEHVSPQAWIWVHAQNESRTELHAAAARRGAWVEFDGISPESIGRHVELVGLMRRQELLERVLVSQDAGWYAVGERGGGTFRGYDALFTEFLPALRREGLGDDEIRQLVVTNPSAAFTVKRRPGA
jgi:phosphotriesterase-related protein